LLDPPFFCADFGGCQITENGLTQLAGTVTWSDGTVDSMVKLQEFCK